VPLTSMPETTVDKYRYLFSRECEVRASGQLKMSAPSPKAGFPKQRSQYELRGLIVSAPDC
jgi:hypothetical protein